jgi:DNA repair photolyase
MPRLLAVLLERQPKIFVIQTRGVLILRDLELLQQIARRTILRVSFSITTDRADVRRWYEPLCDPIPERLETVRVLRSAGIETYVTVAPILPCDPERLIALAIEASGRDIIGDPFHVRAVRKHGAVTRDAANRVSEKKGFLSWHDPQYTETVIQRMPASAAAAGRRFGVGPDAFGWLAADGPGSSPVAARPQDR